MPRFLSQLKTCTRVAACQCPRLHQHLGMRWRSKSCGARSWLERSGFLQVNARLKDLYEMYQITSLCTSPSEKIQQTFVVVFLFCHFQNLQTFPTKNANIYNFTRHLFAIFADFDAIFSDIPRCSRKCGITLQFPKIFPIFPGKSEFSVHENANI